MKQNKLFDRPQLLISIIGLSSFVTGIILFVIMTFTAQVSYSESGAIETLTYHPTLMAIYSCLNLISFSALVWFVIRLITYRLRNKEQETL